MLVFHVRNILLTVSSLNLFFFNSDILHADGLLADAFITTPQAIYRSIDISKKPLNEG
jgi:hypothetical protein